MNGSNIKDIIADIESLTTIVNFGDDKLTEFYQELQKKEQQIADISSRDVLSDFTKELRVLRGSIHVTSESLREWKKKASEHLHVLHDTAKNIQKDEANSTINFRKVADDTSELLKNITSQLQQIQEQNDKLVSLAQRVQNKKTELKSNIERGKPLQILDNELANIFQDESFADVTT